MKLYEKIYYCRKKIGLSQEGLAQRLGVSRQAVSKWETGEAVPEISKLLLLANTFGVTTDWLLSDEEPQKADNGVKPEVPQQSGATWVDTLPGVLGNLLRRFGWLFGVYLALVGVGFTVIGAVARFATRRMLSSFMDLSGGFFPGGTLYFDQNGNLISNGLSSLTANNPVFIVGTVIMILGIMMLVGGIILAVVLKKAGKNKIR